MKLKLLKTAKTDIDLIDQLDKEIKHINAFASKVKDRSLNVCLRMTFSKPAEKKAMFDEDGSIVLNGMDVRVSGLSEIFSSYKKENTEDFKMDVSEVSVLQILGVLICFKESERMAAVQRLTAIGIEL